MVSGDRGEHGLHHDLYLGSGLRSGYGYGQWPSGWADGCHGRSLCMCGSELMRQAEQALWLIAVLFAFWCGYLLGKCHGLCGS